MPGVMSASASGSTSRSKNVRASGLLTGTRAATCALKVRPPSASITTLTSVSCRSLGHNRCGAWTSSQRSPTATSSATAVPVSTHSPASVRRLAITPSNGATIACRSSRSAVVSRSALATSSAARATWTADLRAWISVSGKKRSSLNRRASSRSRTASSNDARACATAASAWASCSSASRSSSRTTTSPAATASPASISIVSTSPDRRGESCAARRAVNEPVSSTRSIAGRTSGWATVTGAGSWANAGTMARMRPPSRPIPGGRSEILKDWKFIRRRIPQSMCRRRAFQSTAQGDWPPPRRPVVAPRYFKAYTRSIITIRLPRGSTMSRRLASLFLFPCLLIAATAPAQTVDFDVLVDTDRSAATGCSVTPSGSAALSGFERRIRASVDPGSFEVIALEQSACAGAGFDTPVPVSGFATPYPLALNTGIGGADAVELAVARAALGAANLNQLRLTFVADSDSGSDVLATTNGGAGGGPIVFGLPVQIPALSVWGLGALVLVLLALAWLAHRRLGRVGAVMAVMLVTTAAWAMTFALDGDLTDWGGRAPNATDPAGDATDSSAAIDLVAGFVVLDGDDLFFRMDVSDTENQAPVAVDDAFSTDEDTSLNIAAPGVLSNDSDAELDPITAVLDAGPANAVSFNLNADGSFDYVPNADFNGSDSFTYFANDGQADSAAATVTITVNAINDAPVAVDDVATTNEDTQVDIDVLANDSDVDGGLDPATVSVTSGPANGAASVNTTTGVITYTKSGDFNGTDSFVYEVCDDGTPLPALCTTATVSINVDPVNDAPSFTASNPPAVDEDAGPQTVSGWVTAFDPGPGEGGQSVLAYIVSNVSTPGLFSAGPAVDAAGNLNYTPAADAFGSSTFDVAVRDDGGTANGGTDTSPTQTFTITVNAVNDAPTVADDSASTDEDMSVDIDVLANDSDSDGSLDPATVMVTSGPTSGGTSVNMTTGVITYTPDADFNGSDAFTYQVCDDGTPTPVECASATVTITVNAVNDAPIIAFPSGGTSFDNTGPVLLDPSATLNDVDSPDFDTGDLTASLTLSADSSMCDVLDVLTIENQGMGAGQIGFNGTDVSFGGTTFGTVTTPYLCTDSGGGVFDIQPLLISFDPNASQAAVTALLRALQYNTTSTDDQDREASAMVTDGDGGTSNAAVTTITVNLNAPPTATDDTFSIDENSADGAAVGTVSATDPDAGQTLSYAITAGNTNTTFAINSSTGAITLNNPPG